MRADIDGAQQELGEASRIARELDIRHRFDVSYWQAFCLYQKGALAEARQLYEDYLQNARSSNRQRGVIGAQIHLAEIALLQGNLAQAEEALKESDAMAHHCGDRGHFPDILRTHARLHIVQNNISAAHDCLAEAIDLYERLGMRHDLAAARQELAELSTLVSLESNTTVK